MGRLYKREGSECWHMTFMVNGKQVRQSTKSPIGAGKWQQRENKKEAQKILNAELIKVAQGKWFGTPLVGKTFIEMMEKYRTEHAAKKKSALTFYEGRINGLLAYFKGCMVGEITSVLVKQYKADRIKEGVKVPTINRALSVLRHAFNLAINEWEWPGVENPFTKIKLERENNKRTRFLTPEEEGKILGECSPALAEVVRFALGTGMRLGEIVGLTWDNMDLSRRVAILEETKNGETRTVPLDAVIEVVKNRPRSIKTNHLFYTEDHTARNIHNVTRDFHRAVSKAGIDDVRFHDLRHTFASRCVQAGCDISAVQKLLGHKSITMTMRYAHHDTASLQGAVETMRKFQDTQKAEAEQRAAINEAR